MRSLLSARGATVGLSTVVALVLLVASTATVAGKRPTNPPPTPKPTAAPTIAPTSAPAGSVQIAIAATGILEPNRQYANVDVTVTCPQGWTVTQTGLHIRQQEPGGVGGFAVTCTGAAQVARARVVNGNKWTLGNATATAYVTISRNGQSIQESSQRVIQLQPGVVVRVADQGQLTGTSGGGARLAVAVACPSGATGQSSTLSVTQGAASGQASFTPTCDGTSRTQVIAITAGQGTFQTGAASGNAAVNVDFSNATFTGADARAITILETSTGDTTPPTAPTNLWANVFGDGETWLSWSASTDNATPTGLIVYEVYLNGRFDQPIGGGLTDAILYADLGVVSTIEVFAMDGAGNRSAPATVTVDCTQGWCQ
jgi:hypothetical protein